MNALKRIKYKLIMISAAKIRTSVSANKKFSCSWQSEWCCVRFLQSACVICLAAYRFKSVETTFNCRHAADADGQTVLYTVLDGAVTVNDRKSHSEWHDTIRYDTELNVVSKAECDRLNLAQQTKTKNASAHLVQIQMVWKLVTFNSVSNPIQR